MTFKVRDMLGFKFGRLTVIEFAGIVNTRASWKCQCRCGKLAVIYGSSLLESKVKNKRSSCGNCQDDIKYPKEYRAWRSMKARCYSPSIIGFSNYGGRGIKVCIEWRLDFFNFLDYIGFCPDPDWSLDRIGVDGNYEPGNVRWASSFVQNNNKRSHKKEKSTNA